MHAPETDLRVYKYFSVRVSEKGEKHEEEWVLKWTNKRTPTLLRFEGADYTNNNEAKPFAFYNSSEIQPQKLRFFRDIGVERKERVDIFLASNNAIATSEIRKNTAAGYYDDWKIWQTASISQGEKDPVLEQYWLGRD